MRGGGDFHSEEFLSWAYQQREKRRRREDFRNRTLLRSLSCLPNAVITMSLASAPQEASNPFFGEGKIPHPPSHVKKSLRSSSSSFGRADVVVSDFVLRSLFEEEEDGNFTRRPPSRRRRRRRKSFAKPLRVCCVCRSWECACVCVTAGKRLLMCTRF